MITKSVRLTESEAEELHDFSQAIGEVEAAVAKRALLRGLRDIRIERGILAYLDGWSSSEAAELAGIGRGAMLEILMDKGITVIHEVPDLATQLATAARYLGSERLAAIAEKLAAEKAAERTSE